MPTPIPELTTRGLSVPTYSDYYQFLTSTMQSLYGEDIYIDNDSQDGQLIQIQALAMADTAKVLQSLYQSFSPTYASGSGLSRLVKINNIRRKTATYSTCDVVLSGQANTVIRSGQVKDIYGNKWDLPAEVVIPSSGTITVTAKAQKLGAIILNANQLNIIGTPTRGWQSVTNLTISSPGRQIETDSELKRRRDLSTGISATSPLDSISARVANVDGVIQSAVYENATDQTDVRGIPGHSISVVVYGGSNQDIAEAIFATKTIGAGLYGNTDVVVTDINGITSNISFFRPIVIQPYVSIVLQHIRDDVDQNVIDNIRSAVVEYMNTLTIGFSLPVNRLYSIIYAQDINQYNPSFNIQSVLLSTDNSQWTTEIPAAFNEMIAGVEDRIDIVVN